MYVPVVLLILSPGTVRKGPKLIVLTLQTDLIDKTTKEIRQDDDKVVYKTLEEIGDDLPDHSPRFVLLSYPLTLVRPPLVDLPIIAYTNAPGLSILGQQRENSKLTTIRNSPPADSPYHT